jgi:glycosyltransferase involved in cell wall biosynthesis
MYSVYIDYFSHISLSKRVGQVFNGGDNGTKLLLLQIMESQYYSTRKNYLILHKGYVPADKYEEKIIDGKFFEKIYVNSLDEVDYKENAVLFVPLVCGREMIMVDSLKKKFPKLKIYGRIHDKNHNFPFDIYDRYYYSGIGRTGVTVFLDYFGKKLLFGLKYSSWIKNFDKIFTVSNYSLQKLKDRNVKVINYYYQGILDCYSTPKEKLDRVYKNEYILLVNGGRPEKNSFRTIEAFCKYKKMHPEDKIMLYVTSIKKDVQNCLLKKLEHDPTYSGEFVKMFEYLPYGELQRMYSECAFLLFTSKGEGFGMPVLEAAMCGRPVLASWNTSIPEVLGSSIRYVNPFSVDSIAEGISYYRDKDNIKIYEESIKRRLKIVQEQIKEDARMFMRELYEE